MTESGEIVGQNDSTPMVEVGGHDLESLIGKVTEDSCSLCPQKSPHDVFQSRARVETEAKDHREVLLNGVAMRQDRWPRNSDDCRTQLVGPVPRSQQRSNDGSGRCSHETVEPVAIFQCAGSGTGEGNSTHPASFEDTSNRRLFHVWGNGHGFGGFRGLSGTRRCVVPFRSIGRMSGACRLNGL